jgi:hypothetical protein
MSAVSEESRRSFFKKKGIAGDDNREPESAKSNYIEENKKLLMEVSRLNM